MAVKTVVFDDSHARRRQRAILETAISTCIAHPNVMQAYAYDVDIQTIGHTSTKSLATGLQGGGAQKEGEVGGEAVKPGHTG